MPRVAALLSGVEQQLLRYLALSRSQESLHALRLTTGQRISKPSQDPATFVRLASLENELSGVNQAISQVSAASDFAANAQLVVDQVRTQLDLIREKLAEDEGGGLTPAERAANQIEIDAALEAIDELAATEVGGGNAFDGQSDYQYDYSRAVTGQNGAQISSVTVSQAAEGDTTISGTVTAATLARLNYAGNALGRTTSSATFTLSGDNGSAVISVSNGQLLSSVASNINLQTGATGVTARVSGTTLILESVAYGSDANIAVNVTSGTFNVTGGNGNGTANGTDVAATINGESFTGQGHALTYEDVNTSLELTFVQGFTGTFNSLNIATELESIDSSHLLNFALTTDPRRLSSLALAGLTTADLGGTNFRLSDLATGEDLAGLGSNTAGALEVVDAAIAQLDLVETAIDSFADITIASSSALLTGLQTNLEDAIEAINGIDEDEENQWVAYYQALSENAVSSLALITEQRQSIVSLLRSIAGLT